MLVLTRKPMESIDVTDEIVVTVEDIVDRDGWPISGASVRLGFQSPPQVAIHRSELNRRGKGSGGRKRVREQRPGRLARVKLAEVVLRVDVPARVPIVWDGHARPYVDEDSDDCAVGSSRNIQRLICRRDDHVTICHNIVILIVDFKRFTLTTSSSFARS